MGPTEALAEWFARKRDRRQERQRKLKEHRDAIREFLKGLSRAASVARRMIDSKSGDALVIDARATYVDIVCDLEAAADQLSLVFFNLAVGQPLLQSAEDCVAAVQSLAEACSAFDRPDAPAISAALGKLDEEKRQYIGQARVFTSVPEADQAYLRS
jgi:hypothetical protein